MALKKPGKLGEFLFSYSVVSVILNCLDRDHAIVTTQLLRHCVMIVEKVRC